MIKQKVFIPVEQNDEVRKSKLLNSMIASLEETRGLSGNVFKAKVCLQEIKKNFIEQEGYFFTADELNKLISEVYEVGFLNPIGRANYIKSINIK